MKLTYFLTMLLFINTTNLFGQSKYYSTNFGWVNGQGGLKTIQANDGNYYVATNQFTLGQWSSCIAYVNTFGNVLNNFCNTDVEENLIYDMILLNNNCIAIGNISAPNNYYYSQYFKLDTTLNTVSYQALDTTTKNESRACTITIDNGILLAGSMNNESTNPNSFELHLIKVDSLGVEQFHQTYYNFTGQNTYEDIVALPNGTFYGLATVRDDYWQQANVALLHISSTGIPINAIQEYNLGGRDLARCLIATNDGGLLFSATSYPTNNGIDGTNYLYKLNSSTETQWINDTDFHATVIHAMVQLADSNYVVAGNYYVDEDTYDGFIAKLDTAGHILWRHNYGGNSTDYIYDLIINNHDTSGLAGYVMCGRTESTDLGVPLGNANVYFLKTNCMGLLTQPQAVFSSTNVGSTYYFINSSEYVYPNVTDGGHYLWSFGDGSSSTQISPTYTYLQDGVYTITLTAIVCNDTSTTQQTVCVGSPAFTPLFSAQSNGLAVTISNQSTGVIENQGSFIWYFGDGSLPLQTQDTLPQQHTYAQSGTYTIDLQAIVCNDTLLYRQTVEVVAVGLASVTKQGWTISPNPANMQLSIGSEKMLSGTFVLCDMLGREVSKHAVSGANTQVSTQHLPSGVYLYQIIDQQNQILQHGKLSIVQ